MAAYVPIDGAAAAPGALTENEVIVQVMHWIGFRNEVTRDHIIDDTFESFEDIKMLTEKDITSMATDWATRPTRGVVQRIFFGTRKTKYLKALTHWVEDFFRISARPTITGLTELQFKQQLERALARATIRENIKDQTSTAAASATPGPLESERKWKVWEDKFVNYTRIHLGANGVPLAYVIRPNEAPTIDGTFPDFLSQTIECAPLNGEYYQADRLSVFNMLISFTTGQPSGDWIKSTVRHQDGRRSMQALRTHFAGAGNASRNKAEADRLYKSLHYKSERAMAFETFLTQCQKMFNIFEEEGEPMQEGARIRYLFNQVQHSGLQSSIEALRAQETTGIVLTYPMVANHLSTAVSQLPEYIAKNRNVSGVATAPEANGQANGIYNADGSITTGHIPDWRSLSRADRDKVIAERKRLGITKGMGRGNGYKSGGGKGNNASNDTNRIKQLQKQNKKYKRQINALKRSDTISTAGATDDDSATDAGDGFGGKAAKKNKKN